MLFCYLLEIKHAELLHSDISHLPYIIVYDIGVSSISHLVHAKFIFYRYSILLFIVSMEISIALKNKFYKTLFSLFTTTAVIFIAIQIKLKEEGDKAH